MDGLMTRCDRRAAKTTCAGGFAYLWVLLLVAFVGLGLAVAAEVDATAAQRERERELLSIGRQFSAAIARYHESRLVGGRREYPASLDDLLHDPRSPGMLRHLRKVFVDPMTGRPEWGLVRAGDRIVGVHSLSDRTPIKQGGFEPDELGFARRAKLSEWVFGPKPAPGESAAARNPGASDLPSR